jgi:hypothetical protein
MLKEDHHLVNSMNVQPILVKPFFFVLMKTVHNIILSLLDTGFWVMVAFSSCLLCTTVCVLMLCIIRNRVRLHLFLQNISFTFCL